jgi:hypothetical protein
MSNPNINEKEFVTQVEEKNNYAVYSKDDGTFMFNDGAIVQCAGLASPVALLTDNGLHIEDQDLV